MNFDVKEQGYIYVLVNSAMPDLVKVGKTTRKPSDRANELSGVTGIPTPFIVAYELKVKNCSEAEKFVHAFLSNNGFRVSNNREFFKAPAYEAVNAILALPESLKMGSAFELDRSSPLLSKEDSHGDDVYGQDNYTGDSTGESVMPPWFDLWYEGRRHILGIDDYIKDEEEALECFTQAAKLGSSLAYYEIGLIHICGGGGWQRDLGTR